MILLLAPSSRLCAQIPSDPKALPVDPLLPGGDSSIVIRGWKPFHPGEMAMQTVVAGGSSVVIGVLGAFVISGLSNATGESSLGVAVLSFYVSGALIGVPYGIDLIGKLYGGNGSFVAAMGGALLATGITIATVDALPHGHPEADIAGWSLFATHFILPLVAWHLTASPVAEQRRGWPEEVRLFPADDGSHSFTRMPTWGTAAMQDVGFTHRDPTVPRPDLQMTVLRLRF
ncbi:MAG: hypothetical protein IH600_00640 [Bacteroidetes bacterium]|nr:hypothetical protein [Bacteroidota bacterium]